MGQDRETEKEGTQDEQKEGTPETETATVPMAHAWHTWQHALLKEPLGP